jgi:hypothetical protein
VQRVGVHLERSLLRADLLRTLRTSMASLSRFRVLRAVYASVSRPTESAFTWKTERGDRPRE